MEIVQPSGDSSGGVTSVSNIDGTLTISPTMGDVIASLNLGHENTWVVHQNFDEGIHVEQTQEALTSAPSGNQFDDEGGVDSTGFATGAVLEVRVRSIKTIAGVNYGSTTTSNIASHIFVDDNKSWDGEFQGDDYATISGWVVEYSLNGSPYGISNTVGVILPSPGTIPVHIENNGTQPLFPTSFSQSFDAGNVYNSGTDTFYSAVASGPIKAKTIILDDALPVVSGGTGKNDGTLPGGSGLSMDFYNYKLYGLGGLFADMSLGLLYNPGGGARIDLPNSQLLDNGDSVKYDFNLGWTYIGGKVRQLMNNDPTFAAGATTDVGLKILPSGTGYTADLLQLRNNNDSANQTSFNNLGLIGTYNKIATAGLGVPAIYSAPTTSATKTANFTALSYTPPAVSGMYRVTGVITTTSATNTGTVQLTLGYVDSQGTTHTADIIPLVDAGGAISTTKTGASKEFHGISFPITINNAGTAIVLNVVITGTVSYTVTGSVEQIN